MSRIELQCSLRQLRLGGMAVLLETGLHQAQTEPTAPIDLLTPPRSSTTNFASAPNGSWSAGVPPRLSVTRTRRSTTSTSRLTQR
jgi:hypothetical protein